METQKINVVVIPLKKNAFRVGLGGYIIVEGCHAPLSLLFLH